MSSVHSSLVGKVALITGASSGIGVGIALYLSRAGCQVAITGRNERRLEETATECEKQEGVKKPFTIIGDLTNEEDVPRVIDSTVKQFGQLDILVNNAGTAIVGTGATTTLADYDYIMNINMRAVFHLTSLAIPHLIKSKGTIVNITGVYGKKGKDGMIAYTISKAGLQQYTRSLARELSGDGVRVNSVSPSVVHTDIFRKIGFSEEQRREYKEHCKEIYPMGRSCTELDVAKAVAFLASDEASFITGVDLSVDGAYLLTQSLSDWKIE